MNRHTTATALDALADEIEVIWGVDSVGATAMPRVVVAHAGRESRVHVSPDLPARSRRSAPAGALRRRIAISYDCSRPASAPVPAGARLVGATDCTARLLRVEPEWGGQPDWERLVQGVLPWSAATDGARVLAICETSRWSTKGVEAGVWTLPAARGQGLAAAVVSDWSASCVGRAPRIFYSTLATNASSRRVAERLRLPSLGQLWYLTAEDSEPPGVPSASG